MVQLNRDTLGDTALLSMKVFFFFSRVAVTRHTMTIKTQDSSHNAAVAHLNEAQSPS